MVDVTPIGSLDFYRTGQKVRTECLLARSTLILPSVSAEGGLNFKIQSAYYVIILMSTIILFSLNPGVSFLYYMFMLVLRLKSDYVWYS